MATHWTVDFTCCMGTSEFQSPIIMPPINHFISHGTDRGTVPIKSLGCIIGSTMVKRDNGLSSILIMDCFIDFLAVISAVHQIIDLSLIHI